VAQDKTPKRTGDPRWIILIHNVPVEGVDEFIYLGYCRPDVLRIIGLACSLEVATGRFKSHSGLVPGTSR